jgi:hypothetical protein
MSIFRGVSINQKRGNKLPPVDTFPLILGLNDNLDGIPGLGN